MSIWQQPLDDEIANKSKFAKYHAVRIAKALKAGEDPNLSNPRQETPPSEAVATSPPLLDPNDPEVQRITNPGGYHQPSVESAPHSGPTSPLPPQPIQPHVPMPHDVSPISPPDLSPQRDPTSAAPSSPGGGYFPRVPTFTSEPSVPTLPTAPPNDAAVDPGHIQPPPSQHVQPPPSQPGQRPPFSFAPEPTAADPPSAYYQQPPTIPPSAPSQPPSLSHPVPPLRGVSPYSHVPAAYQRGISGASNDYSYAPPPARTQYIPNEEAMLSAQKHAKWAISALNFEDVPTAVRELKAALADLTGS
jgi:vacuolar protein sorting-associated protein VTA1